MPLKILIAPDKFKGTLSAQEATEAIARGWRTERPHDQIDRLPISDGGDGFGDVMGDLLRARVQRTRTVDAAHRPCTARWWWEPKSKTAIIESAQVIGLAMLPPGKFHPFQLDTFGLGALIRAAHAKGARHCVVGVGGSATNDGGFGLARALDWKFLAADGHPIDRWTDLHLLREIRAPKRRAWFDSLIVAVDVQNPLLGLRGATRVYGPQKGLRKTDFTMAEKNLRKLARLAEKTFGRSHVRTPGAGAAGGLGFGLMTFLGANVELGFELFAASARLEKRLRTADIVITGEGCLDRSTMMGKGVGEVAQRCRRLKIDCIGIAGTMSADKHLQHFFTMTGILTDLVSSRRAKADAAKWLEKLSERLAADFLQDARDSRRKAVQNPSYPKG